MRSPKEESHTNNTNFKVGNKKNGSVDLHLDLNKSNTN
jgi:hypothetical protein